MTSPFKSDAERKAAFASMANPHESPRRKKSWGVKTKSSWMKYGSSKRMDDKEIEMLREEFKNRGYAIDARSSGKKTTIYYKPDTEQRLVGYDAPHGDLDKETTEIEAIEADLKPAKKKRKQRTHTVFDVISNGERVLTFDTKAEAEEWIKKPKEGAFNVPSPSIVQREAAGYHLGEGWRSDFDYEGMLEYGTKADLKMGEKRLKKLYNSYEDVNYHDENHYLGKAIDALKAGNTPEAETALDSFRAASKQTLRDLFPKPEKLFEVTFRDLTNSDRFLEEDGFGFNTPMSVWAKDENHLKELLDMKKLEKDQVAIVEIKEVEGVVNDRGKLIKTTPKAKYALFWEGKELTDLGHFNTKEEAETTRGIETTQMEFAEYSPEELRKKFTVKEVN